MTLPLRILSTACLLALLPLSLDAQMSGLYDAWRWVSFGTDAGLPSERVLRVFECGNGDVWAQTTKGLAWFDGFRWHPIDLPGVSNKDESYGWVVVDSLGLLCAMEAQLFEVRRDTILPLTEKLHAAGVPVFMGWRNDAGDIVVQGESAMHLLRADSLRPFPSPYDSSAFTGWGQRPTTDYMFVSVRGLWLKLGGKLFRLLGQKWEQVLSTSTGFLRVHQLVETPQGTGVAVMETVPGTVEVFEWTRNGPFRTLHGEVGELIASIDIGSDGTVLLLYTSGELRLRENGTWRSLLPLPPPVVQPLSVLYRKNGDLWVASEKGLFLCRLSSHRWRSWKNEMSGLRNIIGEILRTTDGTFWIGTRDGVEIRAPGAAPRWISEIGGRRLGRITAIGEDDHGNIWLGSGASFEGAYRWDGQRWRHFGAADGLPASRVHQIVQDKHRRLWFLGIGTGVIRGDLSGEPGAFVLENGRFTRWGKPEGLLDGRVYTMAEDRNGALWFGTLSGLSRWSNGKWKYWQHSTGLQYDRVWTLAVDSTNRVWFGHQWWGLGYIDGDGPPHYYTTDDGLVSDQVWDLEVDTHGKLWVSTAEGASCLNGSQWTTFDAHSGLQNSRLWPLRIWKETVYLGTQGSGVAILTLDSANSIRPRVRFADPVFEGSDVTLSWIVNAYWADIPPQLIETRSRLSGEAWSPWSANRSMLLRDVSGGNYIFEVQVRGTGEKDQQTVVTQSITVPPPLFFRPIVSIPMVVLLLLVLGLAVLSVFRKRRFDRTTKQDEARFRAHYKGNPIPTFTFKRVGEKFILDDYNDAASQMTEGRIREWIGGSFTALFATSHEMLECMALCYAQKQTVRRGIHYTFPTNARPADLEVTFACVAPDMILLHIEDVSERTRAESDVRESREQLRALAARLQSVREEERTQLSREIHDELGQIITGLKMDLAFIRKRIPDDSTPIDARVTQRIDQMNTLLEDSILVVRRIASQLRPGVLDDLGLIAALEWQAREFESRTDLACSVRVQTDEPDLTREQSTTLFRIFQEALTNVARHAGATAVDVVLVQTQEDLVLEVKDNGCGIRTGDVDRTGSLGILGMEERAHRIGGTLDVHGAPGRGTTVRVSLPRRQVSR